MKPSEKLSQQARDLRAKASAIDEQARAARRAEREEARCAEQIKIAEFKVQLEKEHGVTNVDRKKLDRLFALAWEYGHSSGFREVENYYIDLVDLVR